MHDVKIDQPGAARWMLHIQNVAHSRIAVRPAPPMHLAPEAMRPGAIPWLRLRAFRPSAFSGADESTTLLPAGDPGVRHRRLRQSPETCGCSIQRKQFTSHFCHAASSGPKKRALADRHQRKKRLATGVIFWPKKLRQLQDACRCSFSTLFNRIPCRMSQPTLLKNSTSGLFWNAKAINSLSLHMRAELCGSHTRCVLQTADQTLRGH